jgi:hypothetical protein
VDSSYRMCHNKKEHRAFQLSYVREESIAALDFIRAFQLWLCMCRNKKEHWAFQLSYVRKESIAALDFVRVFQLSDSSYVS